MSGDSSNSNSTNPPTPSTSRDSQRVQMRISDNLRLDELDPLFWACLYREIMRNRHTSLNPRTRRYIITEKMLEDALLAKVLVHQHASRLSREYNGLGRSRSRIDWEEILRRYQDPIFVPGLRPVPTSPRLSSLTKRQQEQCLAVLCQKNLHILPNRLMRPPTTRDYAVFKEVKEIYLKEQQEYIEWAKALWLGGQKIRACPTEAIELVYLAEFNVRVNLVKDYPTKYFGAVIVKLDAPGQFAMKGKEIFQDVDTSNLPQLQYPAMIEERLTLQPSGDLLQPCPVHPVRFILPGHKEVANVVATELHVRLAEYAGARGVAFVAREAALRCLVESRYWALTVSVCEVPWKDGGIRKVVVLGSEMTYKPENPITRNFRAYRRLLECAFVPPSEFSKWTLIPRDSGTVDVASNDATLNANAGNTNINWTAYFVPTKKFGDQALFVFGAPAQQQSQPTSASRPMTSKSGRTATVKDEPTEKEAEKKDKDDESDVEESFAEESTEKASSEKESSQEDWSEEEDEPQTVKEEVPDQEIKTENPEGANAAMYTGKIEPGTSKIEPGLEEADQKDKIKMKQNPDDGIKEDVCTCKDTVFGQPPPRSFRKWQFKCSTYKTRSLDIIVHCSHKFRGPKGEVILEPILEFQPELGGSVQTEDRLSSIALALALRENDTGVTNVRIDVNTGEVITIEELAEDQLCELKSPERLAANGAHIFSTLKRLQTCDPGHYLMIHDSKDGEYALLFTEDHCDCDEEPCESSSSRAANVGSLSDLCNSSDEEGASRNGYSADADCSQDGDVTSDTDNTYEPGYSPVVGFTYDLDLKFPFEPEEDWSNEANGDCSRDVYADFPPEDDSVSVASASTGRSTPTLPTPVLGPILLPYHKFRKILPCTFACAPENVVEQPRPPVPTAERPPSPTQHPEPESSQRKKWTKKKGGKKNLRPH